MKRFDLACLAALLLGGAASAAEGPEALTDWQWYQEVALVKPAAGTAYFDFLVPPSVFGKAREDLRDLRLYDANGREVEYALRIRRPRDEQTTVPAKPYNQARAANRTAELRLDLGANPPEHNAVEIDVPGQNIRRRFRVEGSDQDGDWRLLLNELFVRFDYRGQRIDVHRFRYPASRFRYLRLTLEPDPAVEGDEPEMKEARVFHAVQIPGEDLTLPADLGPRDPTPGDGGPGSAWLIDFGGNAPPVERLSFDVPDAEFVRNFRLEGLEPDGTRNNLTGGEWQRRAGAEPKPLEILLPREVRPYKLRLVVTDYRNAPLDLRDGRYAAPARQVVFPAKAELAGPLRLYFGNPKAQETGYDFARTLPADLEPEPVRLTVGASPIEQPRTNPVYRPEPPPLTERFPWLIYLVLTLACLSLLGILTAMGRKLIEQHDSRAS